MDTSNLPNPNLPAPEEDSHPWKAARWLMLTLGVLITLAAVFYTEENWRGKRAWEKCRRQLEARGAVLDWAAYIPAPVADEQNVYKAPGMAEWFVKDSSGAWITNANRLQGRPGMSPNPTLQRRLDSSAAPVRLANIDLLTPDHPGNPAAADATLQFGDPKGTAAAGHLLRQALYRGAVGSFNCLFVAHTLEDIRPVHLAVSADRRLSPGELSDYLFNEQLISASGLKLTATGSNTFEVRLNQPVYAATDYLAATDAATPDFGLMRKALERPQVQIGGPYDPPYSIPIPNFISVRIVAQNLSQRAQCYLLLGQPEAALRELTLVHDLCHLLDTRPVTLVAPMINVAVSGLYTSVVQDGLRVHAWTEPQLAVVERQLKEIDLLPAVTEAFRTERAAGCRTLDITPASKLPALFHFGQGSGGFSKELQDGTIFLRLVPEGWIQQNRALLASSWDGLSQGLDAANRLIRPELLKEMFLRLTARTAHFSPYGFMAAVAIPNYHHACQTLGRNQTLVNQALVACALERYRLAHQDYPETLDQLVPQFVDALPHDLIGGGPLKYQREDGTHFRLYSIGWNGKDDGGAVRKLIVEGDWVWP